MTRIHKIFQDSVRIFKENNCFNRAAAISFFAFFSLIPILFLIISALGFILGARGDILERVVNMAGTGLPYLSGGIIADLEGLVAAWKTFGWLSIVALVLSAELVLNAVADSLITIFDVHENYGFFRKRITNVAVVLLAVFSAFVSIIVTTAINIVERVDMTVLGFDLTHYIFEGIAVKYVFPFVVVVAAVTVVYKIFSGPNLVFRYAFYGAVIFAFLWEAAKQFFALYLYYFPSYNRFYGSLGTIMVLLIWMFFSAAIFLFSASVARAAFKNFYWKKL
ncbi:MAG: YihY/virulence factor BrkB family protein [Thermodesulfobacteriota bacterium]